MIHAIQIIQNIFVWNPWVLFDGTSLYSANLEMADFNVLIISLIILFGVELISRKGDVREKLAKQNIVFRWIILYALIFTVIIFGCYGAEYNPAAFIYGQF